MTRREKYLKALRNEPVDQMIWAPNFDYWLHVNKAQGTLPAQYEGMPRNDIVRSVDACIWNRVSGLKTILDASVKESWLDQGSKLVHYYETPVGIIREVHSRTENEWTSRSVTEHWVKDLASLKVMRYVVEATHYEADYAPVYKALEETGDDGVVLHMSFCVPFIQFAKTDAGYLNGYYLWADYPREVAALVDLYTRNFLDGYRMLADGPADIISTGDNMDGTMISPSIFKDYAVPFYKEAGKIIAAKNKIFEGHWCGRTQSLLNQVPGCGLDVVEAIVTRPMADIDLARAIDLLEGRVVLQGGIPSVLVCEEGCSKVGFEQYIRQVILPLKGKKGFILGMSDNVPPNADFSRIESVAALIR